MTTPDHLDELKEKPLVQKPQRYDATEFLQHHLSRLPGDVLKITRIPHTDFYRANWFGQQAATNPHIPGLAIRYIRDSKFLSCRLGPSGAPVITYPPRQ